jgi:adenosylcobyric acid synthase
MNPILLKPEADAQSQVIVLGKPWQVVKAKQYYLCTEELLKVVREALAYLISSYDVVIIEGAGSPAEINLRSHEIVNMRIAKMANSPCILVGDIDKGGVFAQLVGTLSLLTKEERKCIKGLLINKFRGDISLLTPGISILEERTRKRVLGVIPYFQDILIPDEDSIRFGEKDGALDIAVVRFPHISNSTDFDPLLRELGVRLRYVSTPLEFLSPDLIILPGSKSVVFDLKWLREAGLAQEIVQRANAGTPVIGMCGGFQMLGQRIRDPHHVESSEENVPGLELLDTVSIFDPQKLTYQVRGRVLASRGLLSGMENVGVEGYEIHMGRTKTAHPAFNIERKGDGASLDGAVSEDGHILGTYIHGLWDSPNFRSSLLQNLAQKRGLSFPAFSLPFNKEEEFNKLADLVRQNIDLDLLYDICHLKKR